MIENLPDVPPAVPLLLFEVLSKGKDWDDSRRRLKALLPELKDQSEAYELASVQSRIPADPRRLEVYLDGGLNLLNREAGCNALECRRSAAIHLARSIGLMADTVWLTDYLTEKFCRFGRITNQKLDEVIEDAVILFELMPLIFAGIIKFRPPWISACNDCLNDFNYEVEKIADLLFEEYSTEFSVESVDGDVSLSTGNLYSPPLYLKIVPNKKKITTIEPSDKFIRDAIYSAVHSALWVGREAVIGGGAIFSNSKIGLAGLVHYEGRVTTRSELQLLDDHRSINLPWVSDLSVSQIVDLRKEASKALPMFRETLAKRLTVSSFKDGDLSARDIINELRQQVVDVRNELSNTRRHSARFWKTSYMTLGLGLSMYGIATDQVVPALGGLLPLFQLIMNHKTGTEREIDRLERRPGFVLVKAQDILSHAID